MPDSPALLQQHPLPFTPDGMGAMIAHDYAKWG
jgi:hypothetical protein